MLTFNFRGTGTSEGDFSARGWLDDLRAAVRVAARARRRARRVARGLRPRRHVRGVRSRRRPPRARRRDHRVAEHAARLGAGSRAPARARALDGHDPHRGLPGRRHRGGCATSARIDAVAAAAPARPSPAARAPRGRGRRGAASTTPAPSPTPAARTRSCGWCRAPATGCATTRGRSPPCSAGSTARCRAARHSTWRSRPADLGTRAAASTSSSVRRGRTPVPIRWRPRASCGRRRARDVDRPHELGRRWRAAAGVRARAIRLGGEVADAHAATRAHVVDLARPSPCSTSSRTRARRRARR